MANGNYGRSEKSVTKGGLFGGKSVVSGTNEGDKGVPPGISSSSGTAGVGKGKIDSATNKGDKGVVPMGENPTAKPPKD